MLDVSFLGSVFLTKLVWGKSQLKSWFYWLMSMSSENLIEIGYWDVELEEDYQESKYWKFQERFSLVVWFWFFFLGKWHGLIFNPYSDQPLVLIIFNLFFLVWGAHSFKICLTTTHTGWLNQKSSAFEAPCRPKRL